MINRYTICAYIKVVNGKTCTTHVTKDSVFCDTHAVSKTTYFKLKKKFFFVLSKKKIFTENV